jgi:uncharacterized membrane protein
VEGFTVSESVEYQQAKALRRYFLTRLGLIALVVWLLSWPIHLLPHTVLWVLFAIAALIGFLVSPPPPATSRKPLKPSR